MIVLGARPPNTEKELSVNGFLTASRADLEVCLPWSHTQQFVWSALEHSAHD